MKAAPGSGKIVIASLIIILIGGIVAASTTGWIDPKGIAAKIPVVNRFIGKTSQKKQAGNSPADVASLRKENQQLKKQVAELERELSQKLSQGTLNTAPAGATAKPEDKTKLYRDLAAYYSGMKPAAAVAILKNLDPQLVADILKVMDKEQAAQILAAMEPAQAARLIELIASSGSPAGTQ
ncbi:MAG TPA: hypothetical protein GXX19_04190 [Syntrophomonadaceae bacterium]|nr:hypothetical protein [Syntrophomonadaceae bacterium]